MKSKGYITYLNRISQFNADLELIDVLEKAIINNELSEEHLLFKYTDENRHPVLSRRKITAHNRKMAVNHLRQTVYSSYIKDLYEELYAYLRLIIAESYISAKSTPERIVGEHKISLTSADILSYHKNNTLIDVVIDSIFQALENERSTLALISKVCNKADLKVDKSIVDEAVYYLEIRHKLIHTDGYADEAFRKEHPLLLYTSRNYIVLNFRTIHMAKEKVTKLIDTIDKNAISKGLLKPHVGEPT